MKVIARHESGRSGWAAGAGTSIAALDPGALADARGGQGRRARSRSSLAPGEYPVVLEHDAVGSLLDFLGGLAFNGLAHAEGRGALVGRLGQRVAAPSDQPGRLAALRAHAAARLRRRGRAQGARCRSSRTASPTRSSTTRARPRARATASTGHALAPGRLGLRPGAHQPRARRRRRGRRGRAHGADRARPLRDAAVVPQRRPPEVDAGDRDDARRHLPDRGRPHRPPASRTCASPTRSCACSRPPRR